MNEEVVLDGLRIKIFAAVLMAMVACATAQSVPRNRLTFSGGWSREINSFQQQTATGLGLSYGYRVHKYVEAEAGVFTALNPTGEVCSVSFHIISGCVDIDDHFIWVPFGVRFTAPLYRGRLEFSAGGGGLFEKYTSGATFGGAFLPYHGWGGYFVGSAAMALDHSRHFWLGATPRWFLANPANGRDRWFQICGEFSVRFR
jgi:hypothetical protein